MHVGLPRTSPTLSNILSPPLHVSWAGKGYWVSCLRQRRGCASPQARRSAPSCSPRRSHTCPRRNMDTQRQRWSAVVANEVECCPTFLSASRVKLDAIPRRLRTHRSDLRRQGVGGQGRVAVVTRGMRARQHDLTAAGQRRAVHCGDHGFGARVLDKACGGTTTMRKSLLVKLG